MTERLLTAGEVAERLTVPESWVRAETRAGRMPCLELDLGTASLDELREAYGA